MSWEEISYVVASKTRKLIVLKLETPRTPTFLAKDLSVNLANISRSLSELEEKGIVICLTPERRMGKIYSLTKKGTKASDTIKNMEKT
ncbi:MAG: winged helix-turn-helix transcriptional regulator [Thaumarchaeota archaeon]|nr:winged helix-turn-helix transcriptional regulator [Nitrososphaerota archaeon]